MDDSTEFARHVFPENLFSHRYGHLIEYGEGLPIDRVSENVSWKAKRNLCRVMIDFMEPIQYQPNRYDCFTVTTDALYEAIERLNDYLEFHAIDADCVQMFPFQADEVMKSLFTPFLFDLIELQYDELSSREKIEFRKEINTSFRKDAVDFRLNDHGLVEQVLTHEVLTNDMIEIGKKIGEPGLKELLDVAIKKHMQPDPQSHKDAVEKMWDVFERLKTYHTDLGKRRSAEQIIEDVSCGQSGFSDLLTKEFMELTAIGNCFRIRHHETDKTDIIDIRHYDYLFNRCLSLIVLALQYLENENMR